jgi:GGDEF domain-containing protein
MNFDDSCKLPTSVEEAISDMELFKLQHDLWWTQINRILKYKKYGSKTCLCIPFALERFNRWQSILERSQYQDGNDVSSLEVMYKKMVSLADVLVDEKINREEKEAEIYSIDLILFGEDNTLDGGLCGKFTQKLITIIGDIKAWILNHDHLTGLLTRRALEDMSKILDNQIDSPRSIIILDIDNFKAINDTYGHSVGDMVIEAFAKAIKQSIRSSDIRFMENKNSLELKNTRKVKTGIKLGYRIGGEEFAVVVVDNLLVAGSVAHRIKKKVSEEFEHTISEGKIKILRPPTCSIGIASCDIGPRQLSSLLTEADENLYKAKRSGKDCVVGPHGIIHA